MTPRQVRAVNEFDDMLFELLAMEAEFNSLIESTSKILGVPSDTQPSMRFVGQDDKHYYFRDQNGLLSIPIVRERQHDRV